MSDLQKEGEALLSAWGRFARRLSDGLGYPRTSSISAMVETVKVHGTGEKRQKTTLTASGKQKISRKPLDLQVLPEHFMRIDSIVARAPNSMQKVIKRAYLWNQPDRIAARELRMNREDFTEQRERAVTWVMARMWTSKR